jgi:hypothetical protein
VMIVPVAVVISGIIWLISARVASNATAAAIAPS